jgi:poly(3-hydroxybutyrate) depolymerase
MALSRSSLVVGLVVLMCGAGPAQETGEKALQVITIPSSQDGAPQSARYSAPPEASNRPTPLLVFLHSWSSDYRQDNSAWSNEASKRGWIFIQPDFRGPNSRPEACGSPLARQDVLDSVDWIAERYQVDRSRIYLAGVSGGGHMAMLMAGRHPDRFSAVSAWVGISDLAEWQRFHSRGDKPDRYAEMVVASCGGTPDASPAVTEQYRDRSPIFWLQNSGNLPLDLAAGVHDGKKGSVPIAHTLRAYNVVAKSRGAALISEEAMAELQETGRLAMPEGTDRTTDSSYDREIHLRRHAGTARVTIFEGGHEGIATAGCAWLGQHTREATVRSGAK